MQLLLVRLAVAGRATIGLQLAIENAMVRFWLFLSWEGICPIALASARIEEISWYQSINSFCSTLAQGNLSNKVPHEFISSNRHPVA